MIHLTVGVDGITLRLPEGCLEVIDADQAQRLGNELLNCATTARIRASMAAHPSNYRTTQASEKTP